MNRHSGHGIGYFRQCSQPSILNSLYSCIRLNSKNSPRRFLEGRPFLIFVPVKNFVQKFWPDSWEGGYDSPNFSSISFIVRLCISQGAIVSLHLSRAVTAVRRRRGPRGGAARSAASSPPAPRPRRTRRRACARNPGPDQYVIDNSIIPQNVIRWGPCGFPIMDSYRKHVLGPRDTVISERPGGPEDGAAPAARHDVQRPASRANLRRARHRSSHRAPPRCALSFIRPDGPARSPTVERGR
jgi:hypothetical protein